MKDEEIFAVTCATVTMELGIDIGRLERVLQSRAPNSVTSFLQRLGRSGRRGAPPEMMMVFREEDPLPNTPLPQLIPWELFARHSHYPVVYRGTLYRAARTPDHAHEPPVPSDTEYASRFR